MNIAILGATSQIAKDLIISFATHTKHHCILFSRRSGAVQTWLQDVDIEHDYISKDYSDFAVGYYDVVINFVGVGDPARAKEMGAAIFDITYEYDQLALDYLKVHPECKYIFMSSGAVYGDIFSKPADNNSVAQVPVNDLDDTNWYAIAKLYAEARHRAMPDYGIIDVRVFNYFSHRQNLSARFLITDMLRAILNEEVFETSSENIVRDFLHPYDFHQLIECLLAAGHQNTAVDCYTCSPVDKKQLLSAMKDAFGLDYEIMDADVGVNATGCKLHYYSLYKVLEQQFDYKPKYSSIESVLNESALILQQKL